MIKHECPCSFMCCDDDTISQMASEVTGEIVTSRLWGCGLMSTSHWCLSAFCRGWTWGSALKSTTWPSERTTRSPPRSRSTSSNSMWVTHTHLLVTDGMSKYYYYYYYSVKIPSSLNNYILLHIPHKVNGITTTKWALCNPSPWCYEPPGLVRKRHVARAWFYGERFVFFTRTCDTPTQHFVFLSLARLFWSHTPIQCHTSSPHYDHRPSS